MNKQELSAKWSKYCDTNKLVDDAMELLKSYGHRCTEEGVCAMLDKYFTNKEPLIKLFATSKHYIGNMRIAVEREFARSVNSPEITQFFNNIYSKFYLHDLLKDKDENGKTMFDYMSTGKNMFNIEDLPNKKQQQEKRKCMQLFNYSDGKTEASHADFREFANHMDFFRHITSSSLTRDFQYSSSKGTPLLKKGTKTSRAFNAVCVHYGVDKLHPEEKVVNGAKKTVYPYNKAFAEYSDLVSDLARKMQFIISLNPLDYLTMSNGINWVSCHNIRSGGCMGGTMSYMLDKVSIITFVVDKIEGDIHNIPKVYRQMYHYENNLFVQSRLYPQGNDGATNLYDKFREYVIEEFTELLDIDDGWEVSCGNSACNNHIKSAPNSHHYPDYSYNRSCCIFYPENNAPSALRHVMVVGHQPICVKCGKKLADHGRLTHYRTADCT